MRSNHPKAPGKKSNRLAIALIAFLWLLLPLFLADYTLYRITQAGVFAIAIVGMNLLIGQSGQLSIGHSAFFALGAYATALISNDGGLSVYLAVPLAGVICFFFGFLFGWPALRLGSIHLLLATWGLAIATPQFLRSSYLEGWTGGVSGIYLDRPGTPFELPFSDDQWWHMVTLAALLILLPMARNLVNSRTGRALRSIRDHPQAASAMGINLPLYKTTIFGVSALYAGVAGSLTGLLTDFIAPDTYGVFFAMILLACAVIAGLGGVWTALLGGLLIEFLPDVAAYATTEVAFPAAAYGATLILMIYVMPDGLAGAIGRWRSRR
ncbi:MAG: branched-chain amino acid ABC transporter permease [Alphaproteobacteria bacterium]|nr:branched-chain amino acid ABC transporter permease [Alphaproteobacteria bacterium]